MLCRKALSNDAAAAADVVVVLDGAAEKKQGWRRLYDRKQGYGFDYSRIGVCWVSLRN